MEDERMQQTVEEGGGFMDGFEEPDATLDEGKQAGEQESGQAAGDGSGIHQETGRTGSGQAKIEVSVPEKTISIQKVYPREDRYGSEYGGSYPGEGQPGGAAQPGSGGSGEEGLPPDGGGQGKGQPEDGRQQPPPPPKTWTLNHMGQAVTISEGDVPAMAEKALDYDRVRAAYDEAQPVMDLFRGFARQANLSVPEYVTRLRMQAKQQEGLNEAAARRAVEMEDREARVSIQEARENQRQEQERQFLETQRRRQERVQADIQEFISVFPDAAREFQKIPQDVWNAVNGGMSLVAAYARYNQAQSNAQAQAAEAEQQRREAVQQQNQKNAAASTGSMKSAGNNHGPKDPFLEGWDE